MIDCYVYTTATTYIFDYDFHNSDTNRLKTICNAYLFERGDSNEPDISGLLECVF